MTAPSIAGTTTADVQDAFVNSAAATSLAVSLPTSHASGNLLVLVVSQANGGTGSLSVSTTGTAWTQKSSVQTTAARLTDVWYIRDGGSEPSSVTVNFTVAGRASAKMVRITGAMASGDPFDVFGTWISPSTTVTATAVTTTVADTLLLSAVSTNSGATGAISADAAMRELGAEVISNTTAGGSVIDLADETRASAGSTGTRTWTLAGGIAGTAVLFAIAPAASTATTYVRRHGPNYRR